MKMIMLDPKKRTTKRLARTQKSIDRFLKKNPGKLNKRKHSQLRKLLNKRASNLSEAMGVKVHSICD